jgi:hypothetical protein
MTISPSALWQDNLPADLERRLTELFAPVDKQPSPVRIFFRADDIGKIDNNFVRMMELFTEHDIPLCPALVPQWVTDGNWRQIRSMAKREDLFCWHQHGFAHTNHEVTGKKCEFGDSRPEKEIRNDILAGQKKLDQLIGNSLCPVFTPPWNRCSSAAMQILLELGFSALSRSTNVQPRPPAGLADIAINIDLHTRREDDPQQGMNELFADCKTAMGSGCMGFMLHHQRMNDTAFLFLEHHFRAVNSVTNLTLCTFRELLQES